VNFVKEKIGLNVVVRRSLKHDGSQINCLQITPDKQCIAAAANLHVKLFEINTNNPNPVLCCA